MAKSAIPVLLGAALAPLALALLYTVSYLVLTYPSEPGTRMFYSEWQTEFYSPAIEVEGWIRGKGMSRGWVEHLREETILPNSSPANCPICSR
jgi:hypothetical protein